ncbi:MULTISPECIES: DUF6934 family protein [Niastella]|uniref:Uncharacterized protein n=1 Tax=Niastella soli TaxID=2821487 RepID=A0ABS3Z485_9BACT|nr:hypothetical protein [Niastella soli]MBO9204983.1 hypothetical protein [Niastella soli]
MKYDVYAGVKIKSDFSTFEFMSEGHNGKIPKRIQFTETPWPNIYNLAFGDIKENGDLDDLTISNNGDRNKILATILKVVEDYTVKFPERFVFFSGSTEHRTRLYRMAIGLHFEELSSKFEIYVDIKGERDFIPFQKALNIRAFLIKRKIY